MLIRDSLHLLVEVNFTLHFACGRDAQVSIPPHPGEVPHKEQWSIRQSHVTRCWRRCVCMLHCTTADCVTYAYASQVMRRIEALAVHFLQSLSVRCRLLVMPERTLALMRG